MRRGTHAGVEDWEAKRAQRMHGWLAWEQLRMRVEKCTCCVYCLTNAIFVFILLLLVEHDASSGAK